MEKLSIEIQPGRPTTQKPFPPPLDAPQPQPRCRGHPRAPGPLPTGGGVAPGPLAAPEEMRSK